jgi:hypothetical protein
MGKKRGSHSWNGSSGQGGEWGKFAGTDARKIQICKALLLFGVWCFAFGICLGFAF